MNETQSHTVDAMHDLWCNFFPDADLYESLTEDILIDQISKAMGSIDSELVSQVMEFCTIGKANGNDNNQENGGEDVAKSRIQ